MSARRRENPTLMAALELAEEGFRVFPLRPGAKTPAISRQAGGRGHNDATTDPDQIREWWQDHPARGIGIRPDDDVVVLDLDPHGDPAAMDIVDTLADALPATRTHLSGSGGGNRHLLFKFDPASVVADIPNTARVLPHVDVRTSAGYVVAPPTAHEVTGEPYTVDQDRPLEIAFLSEDAWRDVVQLAEEIAPDLTPGSATAPVEASTAEVSAHEATLWLNAHSSPVSATGTVLYDDDVADTIAPYVEAGVMTGNSALAAPIKRLVCLAAEGYTGAVEGLNELRSIWLASPHRSGDPAAEFDHTVRRMIARYGQDDDVTGEPDDDTPTGGDDSALLSWDLEALFADGVPEGPPEPTILHCVDGVALFYAGKTNLLFGDPESGKTWVGLAALAATLNGGGKASFVDLDHNGAHETVARLKQLGVPWDVLKTRDRFRFYGDPEDDRLVKGIVRELVAWQPGVVLVDSMGELMPMFDADSNNADDFTRVHNMVLDPLAIAGAGVIVIDHLAKQSESRTQGPAGTIAKKRTLSGVSLRVTVVEPFTPGVGGACQLRIHKDRPGGLREHRHEGKTREPRAAIFSMAADGSFVVRAPVVETKTSDDDSLVADVQKLLKWADPPKSASDIKRRHRCGSDRSRALWKRYLEMAEPELDLDLQNNQEEER